jgi:hypothetical protein
MTEGLLTPIGVGPIRFRTSLYADDAVLFIRPLVSDVANLHQILLHYEQATGLHINIQKSEVYPIRCSNTDLPSIMGDF